MQNHDVLYRTSRQLSNAQSSDLQSLLQWLATEDIYTSENIRHWLARTPENESRSLLALLSQSADPEPAGNGGGMFRGLRSLFGAQRSDVTATPAERTAGLRAAILLARMKDIRCLPALVRVFGSLGSRRSLDQDSIEQALLGFLDDASSHPDIRLYTLDLRALAETIWKHGEGRKDLTPRLAELMISTLRSLELSGAEQDRTLIREVVTYSGTLPNRRRVANHLEPPMDSRAA